MNTATATATAPVDALADVRIAAGDALPQLDAVLAKAIDAGTSVIVKAYGEDTDAKRDPRAAVKLARAVAADLTGAAKAKGQARANVLAVLAYLTQGEDVSALSLVVLSRTVLDARAAKARAERKAESEERASLRAKLNDRGAPVGERKDAFSRMVELDAAKADVSTQAKFAALTRALEAAKSAGITRESVMSALDGVYGV